MAKPTQANIQTATQLLAQVAASGGGRAAAAGRVYEGLFDALAPVIGAAGVLALFARSVKLAKAEFPCLGEISIAAEATGAEVVFTGSPTSSTETNVHVAQKVVGCLSKLDPATASEVATGLYATFFGLIANFIGERLVWQMVKKAFPAIDETVPFKETE